MYIYIHQFSYNYSPPLCQLSYREFQLQANALGKGMNPTILLPAMGK